jgi:hypothetical protein
MYTCDKCKGTSTDSKFCENPASCPAACKLKKCVPVILRALLPPLDSKILQNIRSVFNKRYYEVLFEDQEITVLHCYASLSQN